MPTDITDRVIKRYKIFHPDTMKLMEIKFHFNENFLRDEFGKTYSFPLKFHLTDTNDVYSIDCIAEYVSWVRHRVE